jgi:transcriptional antiterminator RfaH
MSQLAKWFLIYTKPRQEQCAKDNLERQSYECFLPLISVQKIKLGKCVEAEECLFPRYLFIHLIVGVSNFSPIRSTKGVSHLVRFAGIPTQVPDYLIEALRSRPVQQETLFSPGDQLKAIAGPFAGLDAEFVKLHQNKNGEVRAMVLLDFLAKQQRVSLPLSDLQSA